MTEDDIRMTLDEAQALAERCLIAAGCDRDNARACAERMVQAERDACPSHGLFRLPWYVQGVRLGRVNGRARPKPSRPAPGVVRVDGDRGYAPLGQQVGIDALEGAAREQGVAALALVDMFHIGAMWPEVEALAERGLVALAMTASYPYVAPAGGTRPLYGTNPIGFAWPRAGRPPLVFDQASSAMARGEIQLAERAGRQLPEGVGIGPDGRPSTDPATVLAGAQLGFGGYKGAALAMMVELLAGPLIGEMLSIEALEDDAGRNGPPLGGEFMLAIDPDRFGHGTDWRAHAERLFAEVAKQEGTRLPGERRLGARAQSLKNGIAIPKSLHDEIMTLLPG